MFLGKSFFSALWQVYNIGEIKEVWGFEATVFVNLELRKCSSKTSWVKLICLSMSFNFEMSFCCFQYFQKTSGNMQHKYYDISGPIVFVRLYEEFKTPKRHFGIN